MGKYVMVVQSRAKEGRDADYLLWYDKHHFAEICDIPGVTGGRRFEFDRSTYGGPGGRYLSIFDIDGEPEAVLAEMHRRREAGLTSATDAIDPASPVMWFYKERDLVA